MSLIWLYVELAIPDVVNVLCIYCMCMMCVSLAQKGT